MTYANLGLPNNGLILLLEDGVALTATSEIAVQIADGTLIDPDTSLPLSGSDIANFDVAASEFEFPPDPFPIGDTVRFTPSESFTGAASFEYTVSDGNTSDTATSPSR